MVAHVWASQDAFERFLRREATSRGRVRSSSVNARYTARSKSCESLRIWSARRALAAARFTIVASVLDMGCIVYDSYQVER
jgi:hypothetical protein